MVYEVVHGVFSTPPLQHFEFSGSHTTHTVQVSDRHRLSLYATDVVNNALYALIIRGFDDWASDLTLIWEEYRSSKCSSLRQNTNLKGLSRSSLNREKVCSPVRLIFLRKSCFRLLREVCLFSTATRTAL